MNKKVNKKEFINNLTACRTDYDSEKFKQDKQDLDTLIQQAKEEEREKCAKELNKVHDRYQNEFHGGYDNEETLNQRCIAVNDCQKAIRECK